MGVNKVTIGNRTILDVTGVTANPNHVLSGKKFVNSKGETKSGTMTNRGGVSKTLDVNTTSFAIPSGYHNGNGVVAITTEQKNVTPSDEPQTITPTSGRLLSEVIVGAIPSNYVADGYKVFSGFVTLSEEATRVDFPVIPIKSMKSFIIFSENFHSSSTILKYFFSNPLSFSWDDIESYECQDWSSHLVTISYKDGSLYNSNASLSSGLITDAGVPFFMEWASSISGNVFAKGNYHYIFVGR